MDYIQLCCSVLIILLISFSWWPMILFRSNPQFTALFNHSFLYLPTHVSSHNSLLFIKAFLPIAILLISILDILCLLLSSYASSRTFACSTSSTLITIPWLIICNNYIIIRWFFSSFQRIFIIFLCYFQTILYRDKLDGPSLFVTFSHSQSICVWRFICRRHFWCGC